MVKNYIYNGENGKKARVTKTFEYYGDLEIYKKNIYNQWIPTSEEVSIYHCEKVKDAIKEKKDIIIVNDEEETELLEQNGFVATNFVCNCFKNEELMKKSLEDFEGAEIVYVDSFWLETICSWKGKVEDKELRKIFIETLSNMVKDIKIYDRKLKEIADILAEENGKERFEDILKRAK